MFGGNPTYEFTMKPVTLGPNYSADVTMNPTLSEFSFSLAVQQATIMNW